MKLKVSILNKLKKDKILIARLADHNNMDLQTIQRWVKDNHKNLTLYSNLQLISKEYNTTPSLIINNIN
jgi:hypothetical protein